MTNGQPLRVRAAMKPISTVPRALATVDMATGDEAVAIHQRSDVCAVPAAGVVVETMVALVLARAALEKFGGDSLTETRRNIEAYLRAVAAASRRRPGVGVVRMAPKAVLVGLPGSGKSTIGRRLAKALACRCSTPTRRSRPRPAARIADIFATDGEQEFRRIEEEVVRAALAEHDGVLVAGRRRRSPARACATRWPATPSIYLEINAAEGVRRTSGSTVRPLLAGAGPGREVPRADGRAGSAVPSGGDDPGQHQPPQSRAPWCATSSRGWRTRTRQPRRRKRRAAWRRSPIVADPEPNHARATEPRGVAARNAERTQRD